MFALIVRTNQELKERLLTFTLASPTDDAAHKATFLNALTKTVANVICRSDVVRYLCQNSADMVPLLQARPGHPLSNSFICYLLYTNFSKFAKIVYFKVYVDMTELLFDAQENFLVVMDPHYLDIETSDVGLATALGKALRFAARTGRKVITIFHLRAPEPVGYFSPGRRESASLVLHI